MNSLVSRFTMIMLLLLGSSGVAISGTVEKSDFHRALELAIADKPREAINLLNNIERSKQIRSVGADHFYITKARIYYQMNQLDLAIRNYSKVSKASDYWLESVEEKAQAYAVKGEYSTSVGLLETVMTPTFRAIVGPEPFFIAALTYLKTCDYTDVLKTTSKFKDRFTSRILALNDLLTKSNAPAVSDFMKKSNMKNLSLEAVGVSANVLPRNFYKDTEIIKFARENNISELNRRMKILAKEELVEINNIISKLHVIEVEVIERVYLAESNENKRSRQGNIPSGMNVIKFPYSDSTRDEVWIDELDHFSASIEKCPPPNRRAQL